MGKGKIIVELRVKLRGKKEKDFYLEGSAKKETTTFEFSLQFYFIFVKHTNQGEFVRLYLILQSEEKEKGIVVM